MVDYFRAKQAPNVRDNERVVVASAGLFPIFVGTDSKGVTVLCSYCDTHLAESLSRSVRFIELACRCPNCKKFSIIDSREWEDPRLKLETIIAMDTCGMVVQDRPLRVQDFVAVDGTPNQEFLKEHNAITAQKEHKEALVTIAVELVLEVQDASFFEKVLAVVHKFSFYSRQQSASLASQSEETIRGLLLIPLNIVVGGAEGEAFIFSGKADIKVTNPENEFEYGIIQLKWWNGAKSFERLYQQCVREHATGQENFLFACILSSRQDSSNVAKKAIDVFHKQKESLEIDLTTKLVESDEIFMEGKVSIRNNSVRFILSVIDLFYENVRTQSR